MKDEVAFVLFKKYLIQRFRISRCYILMYPWGGHSQVTAVLLGYVWGIRDICL